MRPFIGRKALAIGLIGGLVLAFPATASWAVGPFDGVYAGSQRETLNSNSSQCLNLSNDKIRITIVNGQFTKRWKPPVDVTVGNDGVMTGGGPGQQDFRGTSNPLSFKGRIIGDAFEADLGTKHCAVHLSLKKI